MSNVYYALVKTDETLGMSKVPVYLHPFQRVWLANQMACLCNDKARLEELQKFHGGEIKAYRVSIEEI